MKYALSALLLLFALATVPVFAQEEPALESSDELVLPEDIDPALLGPGAIAASVAAPEGTVSCFDYYEFNSVDIQISNEVDTVLPGLEQVFSVDLTNLNAYPLVDGKLFVKIYRQRTDDVDTQINGDNVVDSFVALENINLPGNGATSATFAWTPSAYLPAGEYYAAGYFITSDRFNLAGLSFTDDIIGGKGGFTVVGDESAFYFDKDNVTINGEEHQFIAAAPVIDTSAPVTVLVPIQNDTDEERIGMITWNVYYWDAQRQEQLVDTVEEAAIVPAGGSATISYDLTDTQHSVYLIEPELSFNGQVVSELGVRLVREGVDAPRINFPAVTSFPLVSGQETTLFSCLHNGGTNPAVSDTSLSLALSDMDGNVIRRTEYNGITTGDMMAIAESFTPEGDYDAFELKATLSMDGQVIDELTVSYDCQDIDPQSCFAVEEEHSFLTSEDILRFLSDWKWLLLALFVLTMLIIMTLVFLRRSEMSADTYTTIND